MALCNAPAAITGEEKVECTCVKQDCKQTLLVPGGGGYASNASARQIDDVCPDGVPRIQHHVLLQDGKFEVAAMGI